METTLWELFCDTGDPMGYLLYSGARQTSRVSRGPVPGTGKAQGAEGRGAGRGPAEKTPKA